MLLKKIYLGFVLLLVSKNTLSYENNYDFEIQFRLSLARVELCHIQKYYSLQEKNCHFYWGDLFFLTRHAGAAPMDSDIVGIKFFPSLDSFYKTKFRWIKWLEENRSNLPKNDWKDAVNPRENLYN